MIYTCVDDHVYTQQLEWFDCNSSPKIIAFKAVHIALFKLAAVLVAIADRGIRGDIDDVDGTSL